MKRCILAPHCDDAMLALGGHILLDPGVYDVVVVFATTAWTTLSEKLSTEEITILNQTEEIKVARAANIHLKLIETPEALMRGYTAWNDQSISKSDLMLIGKLWEELSEIFFEYDDIYFPLAIGGHVDHRIVRHLVLQNYLKLQKAGVNLYAYEDLPYAWYGDNDKALNSLIKKHRVTPITLDISSSINKKMDLLRIYRSQLSNDDLQKVFEYSQSIGDKINKERVWKLHMENDSRLL